MVVFDRDGKYLTAWGTGEVTDPHGLKIVNDIVYTTDRSDSVAKSFTLDGKVLLTLGQRGVHSDTGCTGAPWLAQRAAGPFNHPTEMIAHPNGDIYVGTGEGNNSGDSYYGSGILKSTDGGNTWLRLGGSTFGKSTFTRLIINPTRGTIIAATNTGHTSS